MCVRQPGVQREQRDLDGEGNKESEEEPHLFSGFEVQLTVMQLGQDLNVIERAARFAIDVDNGHQHQHGANHGVQEKLHSGIDSTVVPIDADQ